MTLPQGVAATGFAKYGMEPGRAAPHWYTFETDGTTGASIVDNLITLRFVDGGRGDDDLSANGVIADAGGPSGLMVAGIAPPQDPPVEPAPPAVDGSGGGGGCTVGDPSRADATLALLFVAAIAVTWRRRKCARRA
jgi:hypothetical protein